MSALLERWLGRLPIGWLQLIHHPARLAAAIAGVAFANLLIFMQLGFMGALIGSIALPYQAMNADILLSASDTNTLADGSPLPRQRMYEALALPAVKAAMPLYYGKIDWKMPDGTIRTLDVFGIDPATDSFRPERFHGHLSDITRFDIGLLDAGTRNPPPGVMEEIAEGRPYEFEAKGRTLTITGLIAIGGGITADGYLLVSDQTFLRLFPQRSAGAPNHILLQIGDGQAVEDVARQLRQLLPASDTLVRTLQGAIARDQHFQSTQKPVGLVFGFGVGIGLLVGVVIVYQVLSADVADHIREYATFKAVGYRHRFFLSIVFEEAIILALLGFVPGLLIATGLYALVAKVASLPIAMTAPRLLGVFIATLLMCCLSGAIATRKLKTANPADLF